MPYYRRWGGWRDFVPYEPRYWRRNWRRKAQPAEPREPQPARAPVPVPVPCTPSVAQEKPAEKVFASNAKCASCKVPLLFLEKENQGGSDMHVQCHGCSSVNLIGTGSEQRRKLGTLKLININTADAAAGPLHYNGGKSQLSKGATDSHPVYQCNTNDYDPYFKIVFYDLATSGLARNCDILSLSARSGNTSFKTYINPVQRIEPGATKIHHLTNVNGQLYRLGQHVASVPLKDALGQFLKFLSGLGGPCLLVAHNGTDFASVRLVFAIKCCQMVDEFGKVVNGFVDSLPLFWRKLNRSFNCSQAQLAAEFLQITDGSAKDVEVLQKLCAHFEFDEGHFIDSRNYLSFTNRSISISINKVDDCSTMPSMNKTVAGCMSPSFNKANILHVSPSPGINKANILHVSPGVNKANVLNVSPGINKANILNVSTGINKANNLNVGTSCNKVNDCIISPSINKVTVPCDVKVVFYDLETSGLTKTCDILQLAARCGDNSFETFVKPIKKIAAAATKINHMTNVDGQLHRHGQLLPSVPIKEALEKFYEYLSGLGGQCVLVAHNGLEFDSLRLAYWIKRNRLVDKFSNVVNGFADTLPLFRTKLRRFDRCSQTHLAAEFLQISDEDAHDAVNDVVVLQKLCSCFQFDQGHFMGRDNYITYTARF